MASDTEQLWKKIPKADRQLGSVKAIVRELIMCVYGENSQ
jgi:hypothetical protein